MHASRRYLNRSTAGPTDDELAQRYAAAEHDPAARRALIEEERTRRKEEVNTAEALEEALRKKLSLYKHAQSRRERARETHDRGRHLAVLERVGTRVGHRKLLCLPDPQRSSRVPLSTFAQETSPQSSSVGKRRLQDFA